MTAFREPYSHRTDSRVPRFPDEGHVLFMDGDCVLCSRAARAIAARDRRAEFRFCTISSPLGSAILRHYGLDPSNPASWLYLCEGRPHESLDAVIRVGTRLGGAGRLLVVFRLLPARAQHRLYELIARNRYRISGRQAQCLLPDPCLRGRLLG
jgi:predicted DCC family thiol-disulfide oxidoreductase YuxK